MVVCASTQQPSRTLSSSLFPRGLLTCGAGREHVALGGSPDCSVDRALGTLQTETQGAEALSRNQPWAAAPLLLLGLGSPCEYPSMLWSRTSVPHHVDEYVYLIRFSTVQPRGSQEHEAATGKAEKQAGIPSSCSHRTVALWAAQSLASCQAQEFGPIWVLLFPLETLQETAWINCGQAVQASS